MTDQEFDQLFDNGESILKTLDLSTAHRINYPTDLMTDLSPAAQAVLDAALDADFCIEFTDLEATMKASVQRVAAATLRAAADQVVPPDPCGDDCCIDLCVGIRAELLAIAAELEAQ